ncbi:MAG: IS256 family transposase [Deltaproteobacteria bacterium]|nr:IS256 family transposase [Deltaproteobacteria bacterium]
MACRVNDNNLQGAIELIAENGFDGMAEAVSLLVNEAMHVERNRHLQAKPYERTDKRQGDANGYKNKTLKSRLGKLDLLVPQVRDGDFYPSVLEKGLRSERALKLAVAEMYVQGVSTRRVKEITEVLCGFEVSSTEVSRVSKEMDKELEKWRQRPLGKMCYLILDARYEKVRQNGCVVDSAVLIAHGVDEHGKRRVLGMSVSLSEAEVHWRTFMESLVKRGLNGLTLIVSDAHSGLRSARRAVFPSVPWQRCQFHLQQNAQSYISKRSLKSSVAADIRSVFNAPNRDEANRLLKLLIEKYQKTEPSLSQWMEENIPEGLSIMAFPEAHQRRMRTSNMAERTNKEIRRRTRVVGIFPNVDACLRLVTAILIETDEDWQQGKIYLSMDELD